MTYRVFLKKKAEIVFLFFVFMNINAQNSALSVHLAAKDDIAGDIIMKTLKIPHKTLYTYYCALSWNTGSEAGGYCGMQNHPTGNNFIFSIWDPISSSEPIKAAYTGAGTKVENFGGEGTGLKSWNFELGWAEGNDYQLVARRWDHDTHTYFGYWVQDINSKNWIHLVTMDFPVANVKFNGSTNSFLEDWSSTGQNMRKVFQKDGYKRRTNGIWEPFNDVSFRINTYDIEPGRRSYNYKDNYDASIEDGYYFMQSGGTTTPSFSGTSTNLTYLFPGSPTNSPINFFITNLTETELSWTVPNSSTSQFRLQVQSGGDVIVDSIITDDDTVPIITTNGILLRITLEDVLGNTTTKKIVVGSQDFAPRTPAGLKVDDNGSSSIRISWDNVENASLYEVQVQENFSWKTVGSTNSNSFTINNLEGRTRYRARVSAINDFGKSSFSEYVFAITTVSNENIISKDDWSVIYYDSEETAGENGKAANSIDGDENTYWHTAWSSSAPTHPHEIVLDLGNKYSLKGFKYLPRQDGGVNGIIKDYEFYVSEGGENWENAISFGTFEPNTSLKEIDFPQVEGSYVRLVALSEINGGAWTSMAELTLVGDLIVGVNDKFSLPIKYELKSAYPNPFNPTTKISYSLPEITRIKISIYNSIGKLVKILVDSLQHAGNYNLNFNASELASGIYFCKMVTPSFTQTQKLILLK
jgi:hypothetical protein